MAPLTGLFVPAVAKGTLIGKGSVIGTVSEFGETEECIATTGGRVLLIDGRTTVDLGEVVCIVEELVAPLADASDETDDLDQG